jgi:hypothetical protein
MGFSRFFGLKNGVFRPKLGFLGVFRLKTSF